MGPRSERAAQRPADGPPVPDERPTDTPTAPRPLAVHRTPIPGLLVIDLPVHGDERGWFKENWQREKMVAAGLPDFGPVQNNVSFNQQVGVTRGIHAEPWDKYVSVATGRVFGAWVDLREGPTFGTAHHVEITPDTAVFVPRGVGNAFQTLEAPAVYTYLVNDHWSQQTQRRYTFVNLADESAGIPWPIPLERAEVSAKDRAHPRLAEVTPVPQHAVSESPHAAPASPHAAPDRPARMLIVGAAGQVGRALAERWRTRADVDSVDRSGLDLADVETIRAFDFTPYSVIVNAAAHTAVDAAESGEGRRAAWAVNVIGAGQLAEAARRTGAALVQLSSDYVFDGTLDLHDEHEPPSPLSVYGQTKAAADQLAATVPEHYIVRTSWVIGAGRNFVRTMADLAQRGVDPRVVDDQIGRLSFADELAAAIEHLITVRPESGVYNVTGSGDPMSWAGIAAQVFALTGHDPSRVRPVSTGDYCAAKGRFEGDGMVAPRPRHSTLDLTRITATGFAPQDHMVSLRGCLGGG